MTFSTINLYIYCEQDSNMKNMDQLNDNILKNNIINTKKQLIKDDNIADNYPLQKNIIKDIKQSNNKKTNNEEKLTKDLKPTKNDIFAVNKVINHIKTYPKITILVVVLVGIPVIFSCIQAYEQREIEEKKLKETNKKKLNKIDQFVAITEEEKSLSYIEQLSQHVFDSVIQKNRYDLQRLWNSFKIFLKKAVAFNIEENIQTYINLTINILYDNDYNNVKKDNISKQQYERNIMKLFNVYKKINENVFDISNLLSMREVYTLKGNELNTRIDNTIKMLECVLYKPEHEWNTSHNDYFQ